MIMSPTDTQTPPAETPAAQTATAQTKAFSANDVANVAEDIATKALNQTAKKLSDEFAEKFSEVESTLKRFDQRMKDESNFSNANELKQYKAATFTIKQWYATLKGDKAALAELNAELKKEFGETKSHTTTVDDKGGYLVHPEFSKNILRCIDDNDALEKYCTRIAVKGNEYKLDSLISDVDVFWVGECADFTEACLQFGRITLTLAKLGAYAITCNELLDDQMDAPDLFKLLVERFGLRIKAKLNDAILNGDGTPGFGSHYGIINATTANTFTTANGYPGGPVNIQLAQGGGTDVSSLTVDDLIFMMHCADTCWTKGRPIWVMNRKMLAHLRTMKDANGRPVLFENWADNSKTLLGAPIVLVDEMPSPDFATPANDSGKTFIVFGDFKYCYFLYKKGMIVDKSTEATFKNTITGVEVRLFEQDKTAMRVKRRVGFHWVVPAAMTLWQTN